ncbi:hypothetical protein [Gilliamella sp. ESL0250]|uniref:hypothetical protein n=1 Tax=Gilliamella sp. ESL0250 TaxID=2705036 RepID=UPI0015810569|nr:hypothetical protein [Gilliamella sp. ESL0250]NUF49485.1 hypothetical protein [Gilliamella sp. ESL0250]
MTSKKIIERLLQQDWFVKCETEHEIALVLNACFDAEVNWMNGELTSFFPDRTIELPVFIARDAEFNERGIFWGDSVYFEDENRHLEDITDWFFEELRK